MSGRTNVHHLQTSEFEPTIQKGIPIPKARSGPVSKYLGLMEKLDVGDSFFLVDGSRQGAIHHAQNIGIKIATRSIGGGIRIWRTA